MRKELLFSFCWLFGIGAQALPAWSNPGDSVVVVYNQQMAESKKLAEYYAQVRHVPAEQVIGLNLPVTETISRKDYQQELQEPLLKTLESKKLFVFTATTNTGSGEDHPPTLFRLTDARIRYAVLCYGVPVRILKDTNLVEKGENKVRPELRRNEAAVDSELALLPLSKSGYALFGAQNNPFYGATNTAMMNPTNGVLMVARLDGPSPTIARGLVDKAIQAEKDGLWGRAYFDARGLTNGTYKLGDEWIRGSAAICRRLGFETVLDDKPETFSAAFPMSQIAFYAGWYDANVSGPFIRPKVEFMPGAFAYHLHSFSAHSIRTPSQYWVGPLLEKGATATMGCVDEPYLEGTPNLYFFFVRLLQRFTFGEAAYASQVILSWQTTFVGDPLYCPFATPAQERHAELLRRHCKLIEWSYLRAIDSNEAMGTPVPELIHYLENLDETKRSAVLEEKLGTMYHGQGKAAKAIEAFTAALKLDPTPQQQIRLMLDLSQWLTAAKKEDEACALLQQFTHKFTDYPDLATIKERIQTLGRTLNKPAGSLNRSTADTQASPATR